jgi:hypothetical protein
MATGVGEGCTGGRMNSPSENQNPFNLAPLPVGADSNAKRWLLSWWAIFPALLFIGVEVMFGVPKGEHPTDYNGAFIVGTCGIGLVFSLVLSWIAYHLTGRSRLASTIVFSLALGIVGLGTVRNRATEHSEPANAKAGTQLAAPAPRQ